MKLVLVLLTFLAFAINSVAEYATLSYYRGSTGTTVAAGGKGFYCESDDGYCVRYDQRKWVNDYSLNRGGTIPRDSWTISGIDSDNTGMQYIYLEFSGGWSYAYDQSKAMLVFLEYIPNVGYLSYHFYGPPNNLVTWMMISVYFNKYTGSHSAAVLYYGSGDPPYDFDCNPADGIPYPLFFN